MPEFYIDNMRDGYIEVANWVIEIGNDTAPRGAPTREVLNAMIHLSDLNDTLPIGINRKGYSIRFAACEAAQLIGGVSDVDLTLRINPNMRQFLDTGSNGARHFHGAYGPRVRGGLQMAVERLKEDPHTRQAVVTIFKHKQDLDNQWRDVPCTLSLHFMIRDNRLLLTTHMRSNDVWWGLAYDAFQFTQLQLTVANVLGVPAGEYTHVADSLHVYYRDVPAIKELEQVAPGIKRTNHAQGFSGKTIIEAQERARMIVANPLEFVFSESEEWYKERLHG